MGDSDSYGAWPSPLDAATVAESSVSFAGVQTDGDAVYRLERRPAEDGRGVVVRTDPDGTETDLTPEGFDVRTLVHEYGGGDFLVADGTLWFSRFDDQRVYRQDARGDAATADPNAVTPDPEAETGTERGLRYADFERSPDGDRLYCVRERHDEGGVRNELVCLPADGGRVDVVASGHDFYSYPRVSPDGEMLAWTTWDHPQMPWDGTELHVADVAADGSLSAERVVMGGADESVFCPSWSPDGRLYAVSDRTDWWNLYRVDVDDGAVEPVCERDAEFGVPQWQFGLSTYAFLDGGGVVAVVSEGGEQRLGVVDDGTFTDLDLPYTDFRPTNLRSTGEGVVFVASTPTDAPRLVSWHPDEGETVLAEAGETLPEAYVSEPEHVRFPTVGDAEAHALYYPPTNPDADAPDDERPPLLVNVHGGPTSVRYPSYQDAIQYWTTRGFAVADVNYRGSTGFGRPYRDALRGEWGVVDTDDCVAVAEYLAETGRVDGDRLGIRGGSAGGYAVLCALAFADTFDAGVSYYGVADLKALAETTHKFESRYLDGLVGPLPEAEERYRERSPAYHADGIDVPVLLLQGSDDPVVPPSQAERIRESLDAPHAYIEFEGERHGFQRAESVERATESELSFYGQVFGFDPADDVETVEFDG